MGTSFNSLLELWARHGAIGYSMPWFAPRLSAEPEGAESFFKE